MSEYELERIQDLEEELDYFRRAYYTQRALSAEYKGQRDGLVAQAEKACDSVESYVFDKLIGFSE